MARHQDIEPYRRHDLGKNPSSHATLHEGDAALCQHYMGYAKAHLAQMLQQSDGAASAILRPTGGVEVHITTRPNTIRIKAAGGVLYVVVTAEIGGFEGWLLYGDKNFNVAYPWHTLAPGKKPPLERLPPPNARSPHQYGAFQWLDDEFKQAVSWNNAAIYYRGKAVLVPGLSGSFLAAGLLSGSGQGLSAWVAAYDGDFNIKVYKVAAAYAGADDRFESSGVVQVGGVPVGDWSRDTGHEYYFNQLGWALISPKADALVFALVQGRDDGNGGVVPHHFMFRCGLDKNADTLGQPALVHHWAEGKLIGAIGPNDPGYYDYYVTLNDTFSVSQDGSIYDPTFQRNIPIYHLSGEVAFKINQNSGIYLDLGIGIKPLFRPVMVGDTVYFAGTRPESVFITHELLYRFSENVLPRYDMPTFAPPPAFDAAGYSLHTGGRSYYKRYFMGHGQDGGDKTLVYKASVNTLTGAHTRQKTLEFIDYQQATIKFIEESSEERGYQFYVSDDLNNDFWENSHTGLGVGYAASNRSAITIRPHSTVYYANGFFNILVAAEYDKSDPSGFGATFDHNHLKYVAYVNGSPTVIFVTPPNTQLISFIDNGGIERPLVNRPTVTVYNHGGIEGHILVTVHDNLKVLLAGGGTQVIKVRKTLVFEVDYKTLAVNLLPVIDGDVSDTDPSSWGENLYVGITMQ